MKFVYWMLRKDAVKKLGEQTPAKYKIIGSELTFRISKFATTLTLILIKQS